tara:strand:+ start:317 stop:535 length:219 start_codon:yes stop_codon:yes gene_type:complete
MSKHVRTVEQTGKAWKMTQMVGVAGAIVGGCFIALGATSESESNGVAIGLAIMVPSLLVWFVGRAGAWWFHG